MSTKPSAVRNEEAFMRRLERELAYSAARSDIECECAQSTKGGVRAYETDVPQIDEHTNEIVARALMYLNWKGLLERDPQDEMRILRVKDL